MNLFMGVTPTGIPNAEPTWASATQHLPELCCGRQHNGSGPILHRGVCKDAFMDDAPVATFSFESTSCILREYGPPHVM
jgi:hypothetical protein